MVFKVYYQATLIQVPVREKTVTLYIEASSEEDVRKKLADRDINIEFITPLEGETLKYEQKDADYKLENG